MLRPRVIYETIHQVNIDRNLCLSDRSIDILTDVINKTFSHADNPADNREKLDVQIKEHRDAVAELLTERRELVSDCQHVWLRQMQPDSAFFCQACQIEFPL